MACKYIITLRDGVKVTLDTTLDIQDTTLDTFEEFIKLPIKNELLDKLEKLKESGKTEVLVSEISDLIENYPKFSITTTDISGEDSTKEVDNMPLNNMLFDFITEYNINEDDITTSEIKSTKKDLNKSLDIDEIISKMYKIQGSYLENIIKVVEDSNKRSISVEELELFLKTSNLAVSNIVGTTSINDLIESVSLLSDDEDSFKNDFIKTLIKLKEFLLKTGVNIEENNVIASNFVKGSEDSFNSQYYNKGNLLLVDTSNIEGNDYVNILKGVTDIAINTVSSNIEFIQSLGFTNKKDFIDYMKNLPNIYNPGDKKQENLISNIEEVFGVNPGSLHNMYALSNKVDLQEDLKFLEAIFDKNVDGTVIDFAHKIYNKYGALVSNSDLYYTATIKENINPDIRTFPVLSPGDLLLVNIDSKKLPFGIKYIYLASFEKNGIINHAVMSSNGESVMYVTDDQLKFKDGDSLVYKYAKNLTDTEISIDPNEETNESNFDLKKDFILINNNIPGEKTDKFLKLDKTLLQTLKGGDVVFYRSGKMKFLYEVIDTLPNGIYVRRGKTTKLISFNDNMIEGIGYNKDNHSHILESFNNKNIKEDSKGYYQAESGYVFNFLDKKSPDGIDTLFKGLSVGDLVLTQHGHQYVLGFDTTKTNIYVLTSSGKSVTLKRGDINNIIYNLTKNKGKLVTIKEDLKSLEGAYSDFKNNTYVTSYSSDRTKKNRSILDLSISTNYSNELKKKLKKNDYIIYDDKPFLIIDINASDVKIYDLNKEILFISLSDPKFTHIIKDSIDLSPFTDNTVQMNTIFAKTKAEADRLASHFNGQAIVKEVRYVKDFHSSTTTGLNGEKITAKSVSAGGRWVEVISKEDLDKAYANPSESNKKIRDNWTASGNLKTAKDVTNGYSKELYGKVNKIFTVTVQTKGGKDYNLNNISGTNAVSKDILSNMDINKFMQNVTVGMFVRLSTQNDFKTYRIEEVTDKGLYLSYSSIDHNNNKINYVKFVSKEDITKGGKVNLFSLFIPFTFNVANRFIPELKPTTLKSKIHTLTLTEGNNIPTLAGMSEFLSSKFGVKINIISQGELDNEFANRIGTNDAKAFLLNGEIYVNKDSASIFEPLHEIMHLIMGTIKRSKRDLFSKLVSNITTHKDYAEFAKMSGYENLAEMDKYEEAFIQIFTKDIELGLKNKLFDSVDLENAIKDVINNMFSLKAPTKSTTSSELLKMTGNKIIMEFGSNLFNYPKLYYNKKYSEEAIKLASLKRELLEEGTLIEECNA